MVWLIMSLRADLLPSDSNELKRMVLALEAENAELRVYADLLRQMILPIRLLPTPTKCRVGPFSGVEPVEGRRCGPAGDSEQ